MPALEETPSRRMGTLETAENWLKFLAPMALLVPALRYPAIIAQFARRGIPISFMDNELALRAGLLPTVALLLVAAAVILLTRAFAGGVQMENWVKSKKLAKVYAGIMMVLIGGPLMQAAQRWAVALARDIRKPTVVSVFFTDAENALGVVAITVTLIILVGAPILALIRWSKESDGAQQHGDPAKIETARPPLYQRVADGVFSGYKSLWRSLHQMQPLALSAVSWVLLAAACGLAAGAQFAIRGPRFLSLQEGPHYYVYYLAWCSLAPFLFALIGQAHISGELAHQEARDRLLMEVFSPGLRTTGDLAFQDARRRQWRLRIASACFAYLPLVFIYSLVLWPNLPGRFGGGKPSAVTLWVKADELPKSVASKLTRLRTDREDTTNAKSESSPGKNDAGGTVRLEHCFLIQANSEAVILSDSDDAYAATLVLPRDAVTRTLRAEERGQRLFPTSENGKSTPLRCRPTRYM